MKKVYILVALVVLAVVLFWVNSSRNDNTASVVDSSREIKIGAILPMTGDLAFVGEEMRKGMELAISDYPELLITLIVEDDQTVVNAVAVNAANKLVRVDNVDVVLNVAANTQKAIDSVLSAAKVPGVVIWDNNRAIKELSPYSFAIGFSTEQAGEDMAQYAYTNLGARSVAVLSAVDEWSEVISEAFIKEFKKLGGTVVIRERTSTGESDFRTSVAKVVQADVDAVYFPHFPVPNELITKQLRELGYSGRLLSADAFVDTTVENLGALADGVYLSQMWLEDQNFYERYVAKYGSETNPINLAFVGLGYDSIKLVAELSKKLQAEGKDITREAIHENLIGLRFSGITGVTEIRPDRTADKREKILQVQNGTFVRVSEGN